ncbi:MAG: diguanylate cyclase [Pseudomonadota bacterium]
MNLPSSAEVINVLGIATQLGADESLRLCGMVFDNATNAIMITDADAGILAVNRAFTRITGYNAAEVIGKNPRLLSSGRHDREFYHHLWNSLHTTGEWQGEIWNRRKDGALYAEWLTINAVRDRRGAVTHYVAIFSEITAHKRAVERIEYLAHHDVLTGLPNRTLLEDRINQAMRQAQRESHPVAVLFVDLDGFKDANDAFGHSIGDLLLQTVAERLCSCVRAADTVVRLGGDEFVVVPYVREAQDATNVAGKIIAALAQPFTVHGQVLRISGSIGISLYPGDGTDAKTLIMRADDAMYAAKRAGGNTYRFSKKEGAA